MTTTLKIDFVSDIACPWCAVGLGALEKALERLDGQVQAELHFQPFELNPHMPAGGQDLGEHLTEKYGSTPEQQAQIRQLELSLERLLEREKRLRDETAQLAADPEDSALLQLSEALQASQLELEQLQAQESEQAEHLRNLRETLLQTEHNQQQSQGELQRLNGRH